MNPTPQFPFRVHLLPADGHPRQVVETIATCPREATAKAHALYPDARILKIKRPASAVHDADQRALATEYRDVVYGKSPTWAPSADPFAAQIEFEPWDNVLKHGHTMLDAYLWAHREAA